MAKPYLAHLHAFRAMAIIMIVGAHAWSFGIFWTGPLAPVSVEWVFAITETLFHGSTIFFAIISGALFTRILHTKSWRHFFTQKLLNVVIPYIVMSALMTALFWQYTLQQQPNAEPFSQFLQYLVNGKASIQFWYIPVLLVLFALTPLLAWLINKSNSPVFLTLIACLILLPLVITRSPFPDFIKPQTFVYFNGAYLLGMQIGQYPEAFFKLVERWKKPLIVVALLASVLITYGYVNEPITVGFWSLRESLYYLQKCLMAILLLHYLHHIEQKSASSTHVFPHWLKLLGTHAFAIYFLHVVPMGYLIEFAYPVLSESRGGLIIALFGFISLWGSIWASVLLSVIINRIFGRYSRQICGS